MSNPLYTEFAFRQQNNNQISRLLEQIKNFQRDFKGNARDEIQKMLNSGMISQAEFNEMAQTANYILSLVNI